MIGKTNIPMGMSKGETVSILLKTNQSSNEDLNGVNVVVSYDDESHEYTYNGQFSVEIPNGKAYTVSFGEVDGYKTPSSVTYTAVKGFSRNVEVMYYSEFLTINVTNDSGSINDFELTIFKQETVGVATKYTRLEYIEATGTQYMDTGFIPTINTTVVANLLIPSGAGNKNLFCAYTNFALNSMSDEKLEYRLGTGNWTQIATPSTVTSRFDVEFSCKEIKFNETTIASPNLSSLSNTYTLRLFSRSGGSSTYYGHARIYSLKIYDNGIIVRDYIPALRSDGIAGLYDAVNDVFYSSSGTTDFEYGAIEGEVIATQTSNSKLHKIAYDTEYKIEASDIDGYTTPESQTYTASQPTRTISMEYTTTNEHLVVNVSSDDNAVSGYEINIFETEYIGENNEYLKLDYIESTGEQWIDTGYNLATAASRIEYDVQFTSPQGGYSGFYLTNTNLAFGANSNLEFYFRDSFETVSSNVTERNTIVFDATSGEVLLNDSSIIAGVDYGVPNYSLPVFALMRSSGVDSYAYMKLYSFKIYRYSTLERNYIPAMRISDGIVGLYDTVEGEFFSSETGVNFKAGLGGYAIGTQTSATGEYDIQLGTEYMITASDVSGYMTPSSQTFTAEAGTRTVDMVYEAVKLGVFIQGVSGKLYETDAWASQETPNGVAVLTEECSFVIALTEASSTMKIHSHYSGTLENYMTAIRDETQAKADYDGATNTTNIMKLQSGTTYAAGWCNAFSFPSGKTGFLPSMGQMWAACNNKDAVDAALTKAGGASFASDKYWTSTFYGVDSVAARRCWLLRPDTNSVSFNSIGLSYLVRAFCSL